MSAVSRFEFSPHPLARVKNMFLLSGEILAPNSKYGEWILRPIFRHLAQIPSDKRRIRYSKGIVSLLGVLTYYGLYLLCSQSYVIDTDIVNQAGEETCGIEIFVGTKV